jgi:hypothetical protein
MARFEKKFVKSIYKNSGGFLPSWPLGKQVKLGDVIDLKRKRMDYLGTLLDPSLNISIVEDTDPTTDDTKWQASKSVNVVMKAKGEAAGEGSKLPIEKAGITLNFTKKGGFLFQPKGMRIDRIKNLISVRKEAKEKLFKEMFNLRKVYIVTEVGIVNSYSLTISESKSSKLEVAAEGKVTISTQDLADASLNLEVKTESALDFSVVGATGGSIFYKAEKLILRPDEKVKLLDRKPELRNVNDEYLLSFVESDYLKENGIDKICDFVPLSLDDTEELIGDEYYG